MQYLFVYGYNCISSVHACSCVKRYIYIHITSDTASLSSSLSPPAEEVCPFGCQSQSISVLPSISSFIVITTHRNQSAIQQSYCISTNPPVMEPIPSSPSPSGSGLTYRRYFSEQSHPVRPQSSVSMFRRVVVCIQSCNQTLD